MKNKKIITLLCIVLNLLIILQGGFHSVAFGGSDVLRIIVDENEITDADYSAIITTEFEESVIEELQPMAATGNCYSQAPLSGTPGTTYIQYDQATGLIRSITTYGDNNLVATRTDFMHAHYIEGIGYVQPHTHHYSYNSSNQPNGNYETPYTP